MKNIITRKRAVDAIANGTRKLARAVGVTIGPRGRNVTMRLDTGAVMVTNDGVTIARHVELESVPENMASQILLQASIQTNRDAGDGTTSAIVLGAEIVKEGARQIALGACPMQIKEGLSIGAEHAIAKVREHSHAIETFEQIKKVATNSSANETYGDIVANAYNAVGADGVVTLMDGNGHDTTWRHELGLEVRTKILAPNMLEDKSRLETIYTNADVVVVSNAIKRVEDIVPILELATVRKLPMVLIASDYSPAVRDIIVANRERGAIRIVALRIDETQNRTDAVMGDIGSAAGATVFGDNGTIKQLSQIAPEDLGSAEQITIGVGATRIISNENAKPNIASRAEIITAQIKAIEQGGDDYAGTRLRERLGKLTNGIAVISVGGATEAERQEAKLRIEDAIHAVRSALKHGVVTGGGKTYLMARDFELCKDTYKRLSPDVRVGVNVLRASLPAVFNRICENAGEIPEVIENKIKQAEQSGDTNHHNFGFDARHKIFCDLVENSIVDPALVVTSVIKNATSAAATLLTTDCMMY